MVLKQSDNFTFTCTFNNNNIGHINIGSSSRHSGQLKLNETLKETRNNKYNTWNKVH